MKTFITLALLLLSNIGFCQESYVSIRPFEPLLGSAQLQYELNFDGIAVEATGAMFFTSVLYEGGGDIEFSNRNQPRGFGGGLMVKFYDENPWNGSFYHGPKINIYNMSWRRGTTLQNHSGYAVLYQVGHTSISSGRFFIDMFGAIGFDPATWNGGNWIDGSEYPRRYLHNSFAGVAWEVGLKIGLAL